MTCKPIQLVDSSKQVYKQTTNPQVGLFDNNRMVAPQFGNKVSKGQEVSIQYFRLGINFPTIDAYNRAGRRINKSKDNNND